MSLLKFTYYAPEDRVIKGYLKSITSFDSVKEKIETNLFQQHQESYIDLRFYWIDGDGDQIDIVSQSDFEIFVEQCGERLSLHVAPKKASQVESQKKPVETTTSVSSNAASSKAQEIPPQSTEVKNDQSSSVHINVECDSCLMAPIVGFRYKCIQCPNFDLCQNCEAKHVHAEHMMVRMPSNNCPYVVDAWVSGGCGRKLGRRHEKRCKSGDSAGRGFNLATAGEAENPKEGESSDRHHTRKHARRHARNTFFSHFYNIMHDLAEGGGAAATAAAEATTSNNAGVVNTNTNTSTATTTSTVGDNADEVAKAAAAAALAAAQNAHEAAVKTAEVAHQVAHQAGLSAAASTSATAKTVDGTKEQSNEKADATTSPHVSPQASISGSPSLQDFVQLLDPKLLRSGMDILNNFNDMFAKMLDPIDGAEGGDSACPFVSNTRKNSTVSTHSTNSKKSNDSIASNQSNTSQTSNNSTPVENKKSEDKSQKQVGGLIDISDVGSDSESDSVSESFIKLNAPTKETTPEASAPVTSTTPSQSSTPPQSLNKSDTMDFAQLSADLKAHIAQENNQKTPTTPTTAPEVGHVEMRAVPVFKTPTTSEPAAQPKKPQEKRAVPIYHADPRINQSVHAMMSMGFNNDGAWLTQLLETVNGNISEALDLISATQRNSR